VNGQKDDLEQKQNEAVSNGGGPEG